MGWSQLFESRISVVVLVFSFIYVNIIDTIDKTTNSEVIQPTLLP